MQPNYDCIFFVWCHQESNRGHKDFQSFALPTELWHQLNILHRVLSLLRVQRYDIFLDCASFLMSIFSLWLINCELVGFIRHREGSLLVFGGICLRRVAIRHEFHRLFFLILSFFAPNLLLLVSRKMDERNGRQDVDFDMH